MLWLNKRDSEYGKVSWYAVEPFNFINCLYPGNVTVSVRRGDLSYVEELSSPNGLVFESYRL